MSERQGFFAGLGFTVIGVVATLILFWLGGTKLDSWWGWVLIAGGFVTAFSSVGLFLRVGGVRGLDRG